jgi:glycosyltransferase involved in cell wall biosynthesis
MKILHLNTHSYGGAAVVARRLHLAALASGIDSSFITKYGLRSDGTAQYRALRDARVLYALRQRAEHPRLYKLGKYVQRRLQHPNLVNRPAGFEIFSPLNNRHQHSDCTAADDPDVVHLHWVAGFVDHRTFFQQNRHRKFVWTLHDMNPFTGGCHHADGCTEFERGCARCPQLAGTVDDQYASEIFAGKAAALEVLRDDQLTIVSPSRWMLDLASRSPLTARFRHVHIANPSIDAPAALDRAALRQRLGIAPGRKVVVFVAANLRNHRKGIPLIFEAVSGLAQREDVTVIAVGQRADTPRGIDCRFVGTVDDEGRIADYLGAADVLVNASVAENSPLTVVEALTCGTPVVAFSVGGIPELVGPDDGELVERRTVEALGTALQRALFERTYDSAAIRQRAARHAPTQVLREYARVYGEMGAV